MKRIAIIGLGLMGGSLGLALKASKDMEVEIVGFSQRPETVKRAKECGAIDQGAADLVFAVQGADIVVIATPVMVIKDVLQKISSHLPPGCIVTDTGSTKTQVMQWADDFLPRTVYFIGGHPMAGKETSGINESEPDLYHGCIYCLTPA
ncbi:MAG: prephenate dehydrogenase/arogenate dehydrogenase family protein, partial [Chloroflexota bacterium]|nr:prephenate dehydrogenase/arogenate dehydrogenase family protein [Chloroflexota bacterium]